MAGPTASPQHLVTELARLHALVRHHKAAIKAHKTQLWEAAAELKRVEANANALGCGIRLVVATDPTASQA